MSIEQDLDDLDRMVDTGAQNADIRSQIRVVASSVSTLVAEYLELQQRHAELHDTHMKLIDEYAAFKVKAAEEITRLTRRNLHSERNPPEQGIAENC